MEKNESFLDVAERFTLGQTNGWHSIFCFHFFSFFGCSSFYFQCDPVSDAIDSMTFWLDVLRRKEKYTFDVPVDCVVRTSAGAAVQQLQCGDD